LPFSSFLTSDLLNSRITRNNEHGHFFLGCSLLSDYACFMYTKYRFTVICLKISTLKQRFINDFYSFFFLFSFFLLFFSSFYGTFYGTYPITIRDPIIVRKRDPRNERINKYKSRNIQKQGGSKRREVDSNRNCKIRSKKYFSIDISFRIR